MLFFLAQPHVLSHKSLTSHRFALHRLHLLLHGIHNALFVFPSLVALAKTYHELNGLVFRAKVLVHDAHHLRPTIGSIILLEEAALVWVWPILAPLDLELGRASGSVAAPVLVGSLPIVLRVILLIVLRARRRIVLRALLLSILLALLLIVLRALLLNVLLSVILLIVLRALRACLTVVLRARCLIVLRTILLIVLIGMSWLLCWSALP